MDGERWYSQMDRLSKDGLKTISTKALIDLTPMEECPQVLLVEWRLILTFHQLARGSHFTGQQLGREQALIIKVEGKKCMMECYRQSGLLLQIPLRLLIPRAIKWAPQVEESILFQLDIVDMHLVIMKRTRIEDMEVEEA